MNIIEELAIAAPGQRSYPVFARALAHPRMAVSDLATVRDVRELSGCEADDVNVNAVLCAMFMALNEGSTCLPVNGLSWREKLGYLMAGEVPEFTAMPLTERLVSESENTPLILHGDRLYFQRYFVCEQALARQLARRLNAAPLDTGISEEIIHTVLKENPISIRGKPLVLDDAQKLALAVGMTRRCSVISGGPGTGKTSIVVTLLRCLARAGIPIDRMRLAAPTGRAAFRMREALAVALASLEKPDEMDTALTDVPAMTLHRLLGSRLKSNSFRYDALNPLAVDLVIIDEASMVDIELMSALFEAVPEQARLILLGDRDQLPPVHAGAVLADMLPAGRRIAMSADALEQARSLVGPIKIQPVAPPEARDYAVVLETCYRSDKNITRVAERINAGDTSILDDPLCPALPVDNKRGPEWPDETGCWVLDQPPGQGKAILKSWAECIYDKQYLDLIIRVTELDLDDAASHPVLHTLIDYIERARILTVLRDGPMGCVPFNQILSLGLARALGMPSVGDGVPGTPWMVLRNTPRMNLFNGDVGIYLRDRHGDRVVFRTGTKFVAHRPETLSAAEPAFAMTVHKSQGSEYDRVLVAVPDDPEHPLLTREILYTAITRARHLAVLWGSRPVLERAIQKKVFRESGL